MRVPFSPPDIGIWEQIAVIGALDSGWITTGPKTALFEEKIAEICHTKKCACVSSATAALELVLRLMGIGPGDEVVTTAYTFTATAAAICHVGAVPILVDIKKDSFAIDPQQAADAVTGRTKAVIAVDFAGIPCEYPPLVEAVSSARKFIPSNPRQEALGRPVIIADCAHSFGAARDGQVCGEMADFSCFSFHAVKNITTGDGGAITWKPFPGEDDVSLSEELHHLSVHGQQRSNPWDYDVLYPGYKCNMTDIAASIGLAQLERMDAMFSRRRELVRQYDALLDQERFCRPGHFAPGVESSCHLYPLRLRGVTREQRDRIIRSLYEQGISANIHFKPLPMLTAYRQMGFSPSGYPIAMKTYENEISLPLFSTMTDEQAEITASALKKICLNL